VPSLTSSDFVVRIDDQPFSFSGHLTALDASGSVPVFDSDLVGGGTARLLLHGGCLDFPQCTEAAGNPVFGAVSYTFVDPTPEPAGMLLVVSGVLLIIVIGRGQSIRARDGRRS
jgi:hypothetical protein